MDKSLGLVLCFYVFVLEMSHHDFFEDGDNKYFWCAYTAFFFLTTWHMAYVVTPALSSCTCVFLQNANFSGLSSTDTLMVFANNRVHIQLQIQEAYCVHVHSKNTMAQTVQ